MSGRKRNLLNDDSEEKENIEQIKPVKSKKRRKTRFEDEENSDSDVSMCNLSQPPDIEIPEEAEVGIVEMVSVINFMCHVKLEVKLGANVNFVIGRNGSGKSAILTAIIVGLGGKANMTHRGNSLKGFIKEGCSFCIISITLRNYGTDAFKPEEYGNSIVVERRLTKDGSGSYKLKNQATGKIISNKKDELLNILDKFNIQIDNPVSILTQDTARSFLNTSDKHDKYTFFLKATQLEQMSSDYQQTVLDLNVIKETLSRKYKVIPDLFEEVRIHEDKYKDMQQLQEMKVQIKHLKQQLAWALVKEKKEEVKEAQDVVTKYETRVPSFEKKIAETVAKEEESMQILNRKREEVKVINDETTRLSNEKDELARAMQNKKKNLRYEQDSVRKINNDIKTTEKDKKILLDGINELRNSAQRDYEAERQVREQQIQSKKDELRQYQSQLSTSQHYLNQLKESMQKLDNKKYQMQREINDANKTSNALKGKLVNLEASAKNSLSAYGKNTANIVKSIEQAFNQGKFHQKPVGPLGSMIKLKDKKWDVAVEKCLKSTIAAYACHDNHDMLTLKNIFRKCSREAPPSIIVCRFANSLYDVSRNKPSGFMAVIDALLIENHIVANTLIDQCKIESVLLIEDAKYAQKVVWQSNPPSIKAISKEGHEILGGRSSMYYPNNKPSARYLQVDIGESIRNCEMELLEAQKFHQNLIEQQRVLTSDFNRDKIEHETTRKKSFKEQHQINAVEMELQDLNNYDVEQPPDIAALEAEVEDLEVKLQTLVENLEVYKTKVTSAEENYRQQCTIYEEAKETCRVSLDQFEKLANENERLETEVSEVKGHKLYYQTKYNKLIESIKTVKEKFEELEKEYQTNCSQAQEYCAQVEVEQSSKKLQSKIESAQKRIEREESKRGNCEEIIQKYQAALKRYSTTKNLIEKQKTFQQHIEKALQRRAKRYDKFQKSLTERARQCFDMLLSQRGYDGNMRINHEEETLTIQVNVENTKGASTKDSKSLSGGERSFSTICFIMALWEAMEAPFRCLDEFDVFMDMLNRRISMDMLMKIAKKQQNRQFILLTPQDMSNVAGSNRVRIFKLSDPERGQTALPYEPVA